MKTKVIEEKENHLYKRKEVVLEVVSSVSPKNSEILKMLSEKFSAPEGNIKIKGIYGKFGAQIFNVYANIYKSEKDKDETEIKTQKQREAEKKAAGVVKKGETNEVKE